MVIIKQWVVYMVGLERITFALQGQLSLVLQVQVGEGELWQLLGEAGGMSEHLQEPQSRGQMMTNVQPQGAPWSTERSIKEQKHSWSALDIHNDGVLHLCRRVPPWQGNAGLRRCGCPIGVPPGHSSLAPFSVKLTAVYLRREPPSV